MRILHRNLNDLDELIRQCEKTYGVSSVEMLRDPEVRSKIDEDDLLKWEAYVTQRVMLREYHEQTHRQYLQPRMPSRSKKTTTDDPEKYAA